MFFSVGILCEWIDGKWFASADFIQYGFANKNRTRLTIKSEYGDVDLGVPVNAVIAATESFPLLEWRWDASLFVADDGENPEILLPVDWEEQINRVLDEIGWDGAFSDPLYHEDLRRMQSLARDSGLSISRREIYDRWKSYSNSLGANWLAVDESTILGVLL